VVGLLYLVVDLVILFWAVLQESWRCFPPALGPANSRTEKNKKFISGFCHFFCRIRLRFLRDQILNFFRFNFKFLPIAFLHWIGCHRHPCKINSRHLIDKNIVTGYIQGHPSLISSHALHTSSGDNLCVRIDCRRHTTQLNKVVLGIARRSGRYCRRTHRTLHLIGGK